MGPSRKDLIVEKYAELRAKLEKYAPNTDIFPSLDDFDLADLFLFFTMQFSPDKTIETCIQELMDIHSVTLSPAQFKEVIPIVSEFVVWFKALA